MTSYDHERLLDVIRSCHGYVAITGYASELYDKQPWDARYMFKIGSGLCKIATASNGKEWQSVAHGKVEEVLWVKEAV